MENVITTTNFTETEALFIHKELHDKYVGEFITLKNRHFAIYLKGRVKAVNVNGDIFIQQDRLESGRLADMANMGFKITNIIPSDHGGCGRIVNNKVEVLI